MSDILQIFSGNPFSTFIGKKVEAATRAELENDDWALNLEICDIINENDDDAKDAVRAIRRRLQQIEQDRNFSITNKTLTVLETCVSNCSRRFHVLVMTKDFIQDLVKLIGPKNNPPVELQERVLRLIERWAEAFRSQPELGGVVIVYNDLKAKGVTFPAPDPTANVPIRTPQPSVPTTISTRPTRQEHPQQLSPQQEGPILLEGEGYNKISQDLGVVQTTIDMFNEIMRILETNSDESDWQLASDLNTTAQQMKDRIVDLIERVSNEDLTIELLRLNDDLNNIFIKYERLLRNRAKTITPQQPQPTDSSVSKTPVSGLRGVSPQTTHELSLIDFNADDSASSADRAKPGSSAENQQKATDPPLDPFDTSRILSKAGLRPVDQANTSSLVKDLGRLDIGVGKIQSGNSSEKKSSDLPEEISSVREQDFAEIENWLSTDSGRALSSIAGDLPGREPISIPNSEFENFIANRALAGDQTSSGGASQSRENMKQQPEPSV